MVYGGAGNDNISSQGSSIIVGGAGNDIISTSGTGTNIIDGGAGDDSMTLNASKDVVTYDDDTSIDKVTQTGSTATVATTGEGTDTIHDVSSAKTVSFNDIFGAGNESDVLNPSATPSSSAPSVDTSHASAGGIQLTIVDTDTLNQSHGV